MASQRPFRLSLGPRLGLPARLLLAGAGVRRRPLWGDRWAVGLLALGIVLDVLLAFVLWRQFDTFPELIGLHFNAYGEVDIVGGKNEIFKLPVIGALIWGANAVLALAAGTVDRLLGRLILGVSVLVQVIFAVAAWRILS